MPRGGDSAEKSRRRVTPRYDCASFDGVKRPPEAEKTVREINIPVRTVSLANMREHWAKRYVREKAQRKTVSLALMGHKVPKIPCRLTFVRISPRRIDIDNLGGSLKVIIDAVCDWITPGLAKGRSDSVKGLEISLEQEKGSTGVFGVRVIVEEFQ